MLMSILPQHILYRPILRKMMVCPGSILRYGLTGRVDGRVIAKCENLAMTRSIGITFQENEYQRAIIVVASSRFYVPAVN